MTIDALNSLDAAGFSSVLRGVFERSPWVAERAWSQRPFPTVDALHDAMVRVVAAAAEHEARALLNAHPDLGTRLRMTDESTAEQAGAGLDRLSPEDFTRLRKANEAYRARFGFPFIYAVRGSTTGPILASIESRLTHNADEEFAEALRQVYRIARFRLDDLIHA